MDNSHGDQSYHKRGLLPAVDSMKPGLYLLHIQSGLDRRYLVEHTNKLNEALQKDGLYPSFQQKNLNEMSVDDTAQTLRRLREEALSAGRAYFLLSPIFKPRQRYVEDRVDMSWTIMPADDCAFMFVSTRGFNGVGPFQYSPDHYAFRLWLEQREAKRQPNPLIESKDRIEIQVIGAPYVGKTAVAAIINEALLAKWPHIQLNWSNTDNDQEVVQSKLRQGEYENIGARAFQITELNGHLAKPGESVIVVEGKE